MTPRLCREPAPSHVGWAWPASLNLQNAVMVGNARDPIMGNAKIVVARNEIDYRSPARFDEALDVFTKISKIGNTSFVFEGKIFEVQSGRLIAENVAVHVWLDSETDKPVHVSDEFRKKITEHEGKIM